MIVKEIAVVGLFGLFDHVIRLDSPEQVTIIHGPNGIGKTMMLKMTMALIEGDAAVFQHFMFEEFSITLEDGTSRVIEQVLAGDSAAPRFELKFFHRNQDGESTPVYPSPSSEVPKQYLRRVDTRVPNPYRLQGSEWTDGEGNTLSLGEILDKFPIAKGSLPKRYWPNLMFDISQELEVFYVETNRLESNLRDSQRPSQSLLFGQSANQSTPIPRVKQYSDDIALRINTVLSEYARHSQDRDRTFPERLVRGKHVEMEANEIVAKMTDLEHQRRRLISLGLLDQEEGLHDLSEQEVQRARTALTIYVGDMEEKLRVFEDVAGRIGTLIDIINARFQYKKLVIDSDIGFRVAGSLGQTIDLQDLSSGEQHELIVLYELLFRTPTGGLVLVDEPEISLHVGWQSRFLKDLIKIVAAINCYAIVATHSPVIIGNRWDLTVGLSGPDREESEFDDER